LNPSCVPISLDPLLHPAFPPDALSLHSSRLRLSTASSSPRCTRPPTCSPSTTSSSSTAASGTVTCASWPASRARSRSSTCARSRRAGPRGSADSWCVARVALSARDLLDVGSSRRTGQSRRLRGRVAPDSMHPPCSSPPRTTAPRRASRARPRGASSSSRARRSSPSRTRTASRPSTSCACGTRATIASGCSPRSAGRGGSSGSRVRRARSASRSSRRTSCCTRRSGAHHGPSTRRTGKQAIHPAQVDIIQRAFSPSPAGAPASFPLPLSLPRRPS